MAKGREKYWLTNEGLFKLEIWAKNGLIDKQIAKNMGIGFRTLYEWKKKYPQISQSLKRGKEVVDILVENALLKRALGYTFTEVIRERVIDYDPKSGTPIGSHLEVIKEVVKEVQPDTTALIFWLKNRKPDVWRDKQKVIAEASMTFVSNLTNEELDARIEEINNLLAKGDRLT